MKIQKLSLRWILIFYIFLYPFYSYAACNGQISYYKWIWIEWTTVNQIPVHTAPDEQGEYSTAEIARNTADNYWIMLEGKLCPSQTASYYLYIASDDNGELWLSTNSEKDNARKIAYIDGSVTFPNEWTKYSSQKSTSITLEAGKEYYIKAIMKEGGGNDNLSIWRKKTSERRKIPSIIGSQNLGVIPKVCWNNILEPWENCDGPNNPCPIWLTCNSSCMCEIDTSICDWKIDHKLTYEKRDNVYWLGGIGDIPLSTNANTTGTYTHFESPENRWDWFWTRISWYICVPINGEYTFYIAADESWELRISSNSDAQNKIKIASTSESTAPRERNNNQSQKSNSISLIAGKLYYIEAIMREYAGGDNFAVWRKTPFYNNIQVIDSKFISSATLIKCGNGLIENGEKCDDGNIINWDGCTNTCTVEPTHICDNNSPTFCREKVLQIVWSGNYKQTYQASRSPQTISIPATNILQITDERGDNNSRYITVSASDLSWNQYIISRNTMQLKIDTLNLTSGTANTNITIADGAVKYQTLSGPLTIINKSAGTNNGGTGKYSIDSNIQITIPAYQNIDTYHSILTFTLYEQ